MAAGGKPTLICGVFKAAAKCDKIGCKLTECDIGSDRKEYAAHWNCGYLNSFFESASANMDGFDAVCQAMASVNPKALGASAKSAGSLCDDMFYLGKIRFIQTAVPVTNIIMYGIRDDIYKRLSPAAKDFAQREDGALFLRTETIHRTDGIIDEMGTKTRKVLEAMDSALEKAGRPELRYNYSRE